MKSILRVLPFVALVLGCGLQREANIDAVFDDNDPALIDLRKARKGLYRLSQVKSSIQTSEFGGVHGTMIHPLKTAGTPKTSDALSYQVDWKEFNTEEGNVYRLTSELNLPLQIEINDGMVQFNDRRYYWQRIQSNKDSVEWEVSDDLSSRGLQFYRVFDWGELDGPVYELDLGPDGKMKGSAKLLDKTLTILTEVVPEKGLKLTLELVYQR